LEEGARSVYDRDGNSGDHTRGAGVQVQPVVWKGPPIRPFRFILAAIAILAAPGLAHAQGFFEQSPGPLTSSHASLEGQNNCQKCHTSGKELANSKCLDCHDHENMKRLILAGRGFHASEKVAGKNCWLCHTEHKGREHEVLGWPKIGGRERFDHRLAGWPLEGAHASKAKCDDCHTRKNHEGVRIYVGDSPACASCHKKDSPHGPARVEADNCGRCHGVEAWKPSKSKLDFNHNDPAQARYPIVGLHVSVACVKCHLPQAGAAKKAPLWKVAQDFSDCKACHLKDEPETHKSHLFELKRCELCHSERHKWSAFAFDHSKRTKFVLDGKHAEITCYSCHKPRVTKKPDRACEGSMCHAQDNKHRDRFVKEFPSCGTCHDAERWRPDTTFDHDAQTKFKLTGAHAEAGCRACHRGKDPAQFERFPVSMVFPKIQCMSCHQHTTVHDKRFTNDQCLSCHKMPGTRTSKQSAESKFHGPRSKFPLDGGHVGVPCIKCHPKPSLHADNLWKVSNQCGPTCHADKLHKGSLGPDCQRCHEGGFWKATDFDHDEDSDWPLVGFHRKVACLQCHPKRAYKPTGKDCYNCHKDDDAHSGSVGRMCEKCHEPTGRSLFNHNTMSRYLLDGKHIQVACNGCHPTLKFKPAPIDCIGCHQKDDVHKGTYGTFCERCHTTSGWKLTKPIHDVGAFRLAGAHDHQTCERCHGTEMRPLAGTGDLCLTCHRQDDIHHNGLGPRCGQCHNQWAFAPSNFMHSTVGCDLRGVHRTLPCSSCHRGGNYMALAPTCVGCHRQDALYAARVNPAHATYAACSSCHNSNYWIPFQTATIGGQTLSYGQIVESVCR